MGGSPEGDQDHWTMGLSWLLISSNSDGKVMCFSLQLQCFVFDLNANLPWNRRNPRFLHQNINLGDRLSWANQMAKRNKVS